jgi:antitoxin component HigA of HigAB toxin-antitoxin module
MLDIAVLDKTANQLNEAMPHIKALSARFGVPASLFIGA